MRLQFSALFLAGVFVVMLDSSCSFAFLVPSAPSVPHSSTRRLAKKGGGGGFGAKATKPKKVSKEAMLKQVKKKYGGTSAQEIAQGTQKQIDRAMSELPSHLQVATQLYQQLLKWDSYVSTLSILQQSNLPPAELEGATLAREQLDQLCAEHQLTTADLHNTLQRITWDASADAKVARSLTGNMPLHIAERVDKACAYVGQGRCLDVGCGYGVLVPNLLKAGVRASQITGVDLSPEMIRNAQLLHPGVEFVATDFGAFTDETGFDAILFCAALHDLPDAKAALTKAASLLRPNGVIVIVHPQGNSHVLAQSKANPILVQRGLPTTEELEALDLGLSLVVAPAAAGTPDETRDGYLAVLQKL